MKCLRVNGTLVVDVPYTFANIDARMASGAEIVIERELLINENSRLYACALEGGKPFVERHNSPPQRLLGLLGLRNQRC